MNKITGFVLLLFSFNASAATYYVDSSVGNDFDAGTSDSTPWNSLNRVNGLTGVEATNIALYSSTFENAAWTKSATTATDDTVAGPSGSTTAATITENTSTATHGVAQSVSVSENTTMTFSVYVKPNGRDYVSLFGASLGTYPSAYFLLTGNCIASTSNSVSDLGCEAVGNGWYRVWIVYDTSTGALSPSIEIRSAVVAGATSYLGDGSSGLFVDGAQPYCRLLH